MGAVKPRATLQPFPEMNVVQRRVECSYVELTVQLLRAATGRQAGRGSLGGGPSFYQREQAKVLPKPTATITTQPNDSPAQPWPHGQRSPHSALNQAQAR